MLISFKEIQFGFFRFLKFFFSVFEIQFGLFLCGFFFQVTIHSPTPTLNVILKFYFFHSCNMPFVFENLHTRMVVNGISQEIVRITLIYIYLVRKYVDGSIGQCIKILSRCKIISRQVKISYITFFVIAYLDLTRYYLI
jgi:hypothetical protein